MGNMTDLRLGLALAREMKNQMAHCLQIVQLYDESFHIFLPLFSRDLKTLSIFAFQCQSCFFLRLCLFFIDNLFKFTALPERIFRAKLRVTNGDNWTTELADQSSLRFQHRAQFYQDAINQMINRSDLKEGYKRSEVLALDG